MNIKQTLKDFYEKEDISKFDIDEEDREKICEFLSENIIKEKSEEIIKEKIDSAVKLIKELAKRNLKDKLCDLIVELYKVEYATMKLTEKRDHVIHALNTYLLGVYINNKYLKDEVNWFEWKIASLFHDIAYPLVISQEIIRRYFETLNSIKKTIGIENYNPNLNLIPKDFDKLTNNVSAFDLIQKRVYKWKLDVNIKKRYDDMIQNNKLCHGILSSLTVLYLIDLMYQKNNPLREESFPEINGVDWSQKIFNSEIVSACAGIYLHNLKKNNFFNNSKEKAPLAYLLKLSDELENYERNYKKNPNGDKRESEDTLENYDKAENYEIDISNGKLTFKVADEKTRLNIEKKTDCLNDINVSIKLLDNGSK